MDDVVRTKPDAVRPHPVHPTDTGVWVEIAGQDRYFNAYWLRDACPTAIDQQTRERVLDIANLPSAPRIAAAWVEDGALVVDWAQEAHVTRIALDWLVQMSAGRLPDRAALPKRLWGAEHASAVHRVSASDVLSDQRSLRALLDALIAEGFAIVTGMPDSDHALTELVTAVGPITATGEGAFFDVRSERDPTNLAFTAGGLEMHTDLPGEATPPGVQFLHCRSNSVSGGDSLFVDGFKVAERLRDEDPHAFDLLAQHEIPFFYRHDDWDYRAYRPVIECAAKGQVTGVAVSRHLQDTLDLDQTLLDTYYPALCSFHRMLLEPQFLCRLRLAEGDCAVFDNCRIVHGREAFDPASGVRHLRGCYTDRGALHSRYRVLTRDA